MAACAVTVVAMSSRLWVPEATLSTVFWNSIVVAVRVMVPSPSVPTRTLSLNTKLAADMSALSSVVLPSPMKVAVPVTLSAAWTSMSLPMVSPVELSVRFVPMVVASRIRIAPDWLSDPRTTESNPAALSRNAASICRVLAADVPMSMPVVWSLGRNVNAAPLNAAVAAAVMADDPVTLLLMFRLCSPVSMVTAPNEISPVAAMVRLPESTAMPLESMVTPDGIFNVLTLRSMLPADTRPSITVPPVADSMLNTLSMSMSANVTSTADVIVRS